MADIEGLEYATCGACRGTGKIGDDDCSRCKGTGRVALPLVVKKRRVRKGSSVSRSCLNLGCGVIGSAVTLTIVLLVVLGPL
jgi:DnaJ-class molecular chaperone